MSVPTHAFDLLTHQEISFVYDGHLIDDGLFITVEHSTADHRYPAEPEVAYPRIRVLFSGSTCGRFEVSKLTNLQVLK